MYTKDAPVSYSQTSIRIIQKQSILPYLIRLWNLAKTDARENLNQFITQKYNSRNSNPIVLLYLWETFHKYYQGRSQELEMGGAKLSGEGSGGRLRPPVGTGQRPGRGVRGAKPPGSCRILNISLINWCKIDLFYKRNIFFFEKGVHMHLWHPPPLATALIIHSKLKHNIVYFITIFTNVIFQIMWTYISSLHVKIILKLGKPYKIKQIEKTRNGKRECSAI